MVEYQSLIPGRGLYLVKGNVLQTIYIYTAINHLKDRASLSFYIPKILTFKIYNKPPPRKEQDFCTSSKGHQLFSTFKLYQNTLLPHKTKPTKRNQNSALLQKRSLPLFQHRAACTQSLLISHTLANTLFRMLINFIP